MTDVDPTAPGRLEAPPAAEVPAVTLPSGGGAVRGIDEKLTANPVTGTGTLRVPIPTSPSRTGAGPTLSLAYDSGSGNGVLGLGWRLELPAISRKTDRGLPQYRDDTDVFVLSGAEDLVPVPGGDATRILGTSQYRLQRYRPRVEGLFARIERWTNRDDPSDVFWRSISRDNTSAWYGRTPESRIADPTDSSRIFSWLICETWDGDGNAAVYGYIEEGSDRVDVAAAHERNRTDASRSANRYLKFIRYGNREPYFPDPGGAPPTEWMFELVLDYGEHDDLAPVARESGPREDRPDPFSTYRAGFEQRTYRLCRRLLMFHHFLDEPEVGADCLVRSVDLTYAHDLSPPSTDGPAFTQLVAVEQAGYRRRADGSYLRRALPPLELEYSRAVIGSESRELDADSRENLPAGVDGVASRWLDLHGEGAPGVLTETPAAWLYKANTSAATRTVQAGELQFEARLEPARRERWIPAGGLSGHRRRQFVDLAGDGRREVVEVGSPMAGYYERGLDAFQPFRSQPQIDWDEANLRLVDLTGDGHADVLITEHDVFTWYLSEAQGGFGAAQQVAVPDDEERGPRVVFADATQSIFLADFSGDGLVDLVRIRPGEVCYWPNLGFGRFGARVTMDRPPRFGTSFDPRRVRLADVDGTGLSDLIYLAANAARVWFNRSGNSWSQPQELRGFSTIEDPSSVLAVDLLGNGTSCLVWSRRDGAPMRYLELMAAGKPHLLVSTTNNLGAETRIRYAPSTMFYQRDAAAGRPWVTRLPFPVQVVERVETRDHVSGNRFVTRYAYHHGHYDGAEREFRGFGLVEQWDTEELSVLTVDGELPAGVNEIEASHVPPVLTRTWFHTGAFLGRDRISDLYAGEFYREPRSTGTAESLEDTVLRASWSGREQREACRALKGTMLRQEVYGLDGTAQEPHPYSVTERGYAIRLLHSPIDGRPGVFFAHARETLTRHYERNPDDPRTGHELVLEVNDFGQVVQSARVVYGRRRPDPGLPARDRGAQERTHVVHTIRRLTPAIDDPDDHLAPRQCQVRVFELTGYVPTGRGGRFDPADFVTGTAPVFDVELPYGAVPSGGRERRLLGHIRTLFRPDDLGASRGDPEALLPLGEIEARARRGEAYQLALTPDLLASVYQRDGALLPDPHVVLPVAGGDPSDRAGYVSSEVLRGRGGFPADASHADWTTSDGDGHWWVPSGRVFYSPDAGHTAVEESAYARAHFYRTGRVQDPFGQVFVVTHDRFDLLVLETRDPLGNRTTAGARNRDGTLARSGLDYRVLQPALMMEPNRNRAAVAFDSLGLVAGTAAMGKPEEAQGDSLEGFVADLDPAVVAAQLTDPLADPHAVLGRATSRVLYDPSAYRRTGTDPAVACTFTREVHDADLDAGESTPIQIAFAYSDGFGREVQRKARAEPGPVPERDPATRRIVVEADRRPRMTASVVEPRWVGSGWTVFDNKGQPVRQYEPFFTDTHHFEHDVRIGVSPIAFYDPVGRTVATLRPDHSWAKTTFDPWRQEVWDVNDTVAIADPRADSVAGGHLSRLPSEHVLPTWHDGRAGGALGAEAQRAATKAGIHAGTPKVAHLDSLGRVFSSVAHNRVLDSSGTPVESFAITRTVLDTQGNLREVHDARERTVARFDYDLLGNRIHEASMDAGERWVLLDVAGNPLRTWNSREQDLETRFDELRRPVETWLAGAMVERTVYGETRPDPEVNNLRGRPIEHFDQAGVLITVDFDFKGNSRSEQRQLAVAYRETLDWSGTVALEPERWTHRTRYDALGRAVQQTAPHDDQPAATTSVLQPVYNEAGLLEAVHGWWRHDAAPVGLLDPATSDFQPVTGLDYDAKGQRTRVEYGNRVTTTYRYDPETFRLVHLLSRRDAGAFPEDCPEPRRRGWPGCEVQSRHYTYDPIGNVIDVRDTAQQTVFFRNRRVEPSAQYTYDAWYRLVEATGREHLGQGAAVPMPPASPAAIDSAPSAHPGDGAAMGTYAESYSYDLVGNLLAVGHRGDDPSHPGWRREYHYEEPSLLEPARSNNRLSRTDVGGTSERYAYEGPAGRHGNITAMPHLPVMGWDHHDRLRASSRQVISGGATPETTWYVYAGAGQRVRKVTDRQAAAGATPVRRAERIYLGGFEVYREHAGDGVSVTLERETLHVMDDRRRVALVETRTRGDDGSPVQLVRYQLGDHLESSSIELDDRAQVISYEEYTPFGSTSYQAVRSTTEAPKRYRFSGMERDEESGFAYHGARYYAPWLGRWSSADPAGLIDGTNLYAYARNNPVGASDRSGTGSEDETEERSTPPVVAAAGQSAQESTPESSPPGRRIMMLGTGETDDTQFGRHDTTEEGPTTAQSVEAQWVARGLLARYRWLVPTLRSGDRLAGQSASAWQAAYAAREASRSYGVRVAHLSLRGPPSLWSFQGPLSLQQLDQSADEVNVYANIDDPFVHFGQGPPSVTVVAAGDRTTVEASLGELSGSAATEVPGAMAILEVGVRAPILRAHTDRAPGTPSGALTPFIALRGNLDFSNFDIRDIAESLEISLGVQSTRDVGSASEITTRTAVNFQPARGILFGSAGFVFASGSENVDIAFEVFLRLGLMFNPGVQLLRGSGGHHSGRYEVVAASVED